jgi:hypothetical protein
MGNTPNNNFPFPESTDLVKDGAQAIEDLADAIDTTLGVYAPVSSGLTLINTTSFSGVSSQSVNDVFSATYTNYRITTDITASSGVGISLRLRVAGADNTSTNYRRQRLGVDSTSVQGARTVNDTSWVDFAVANVESSLSIIEVLNPFQTQNTTATNFRGAAGSTNPEFHITYFGINVTTSYTGFTIFPSSGNITGSVSVYGYSK